MNITPCLTQSSFVLNIILKFHFSSNTSSSDPDFITDIEQDSSYEEEDTENILEEVELGHIRILNMENIGNKKRCREVNSSGDVISKVKKTKTNGAVRGKCSPDKQKPEPKEQRKILSQNREANLNMTTSKDNATSNEMGLAKVAVKESSYGINGSVSNYDLKTEMESSIDQHTKISDRAFQNENERLFAQTKHIVKVPNEDSQENKHSQKHEEGNVEPEGIRPAGKRKRKYYNNISRSINKKVANTDDVYDSHKLSPFNLLSDEIIIKIFEFVPRQTLVNGCALSCKRLKSISYDESLWKRVDLGGKKIGPGQAGKILLRGTKIMRMSKTTIVPPMFPNYVGRDSFSRTPLHHRSVGMRSSDIQLRLTHLDLSSAAINEKCLESLFKKCWFLKKVSLENCRLNESILCYLSQNNCLEVLHLAMAQGVTPKGLAHLSNGLRNTLVEINLSWIAMNDEMIEEAILLLGNNSNTLTHLNIAGCRESLTDDRLNFILGNYSYIYHCDYWQNIYVVLAFNKMSYELNLFFQNLVQL